jgi:soluble lytic murein transglycosylase-like protein
MQMVPGTARDMDPSLSKLSDAQIGQKLKSDQNLAIKLGVKYYAEQYQKFKSTMLATAAYNGGPGSNQPSKDCVGQTIWQCTTNGGYQQTRDYVAKVDAILKALGS